MGNGGAVHGFRFDDEQVGGLRKAGSDRAFQGRASGGDGDIHWHARMKKIGDGLVARHPKKGQGQLSI